MSSKVSSKYNVISFHSMEDAVVVYRRMGTGETFAAALLAHADSGQPKKSHNY